MAQNTNGNKCVHNLFSNLSYYIVHVTHPFHLHKDLKRASAEIYIILSASEHWLVYFFIYIFTPKWNVQTCGRFRTISGHFPANFMNIFHKTEVQTVILKPFYFLKWHPIFDDFYSTERKTQKLFKGLVVGFGPKGMPGRMVPNHVVFLILMFTFLRWNCPRNCVKLFSRKYDKFSVFALNFFLEIF